jgi:cell wall-associated NlpC family hydrolase
MISREAVVDRARDWIGTRFLHQGRTHNGVDCVGLIWGVAQELGYSPVIPDNYPAAPSGSNVSTNADKYLIKPQRQGFENIIPGDVLLFWIIQRGTPQHFAFAANHYGRPSIIHSFQRAGKVCEHNTMSFWADRYMATYCFPDLERIEG